MKIREVRTNICQKDMEEGLIHPVVQMVWYLVHPYQTLAQSQLDEPKPITELETGPRTGTDSVVGMHSNAVASEYQHTAQARKSPVWGLATKRSMVQSGRSGGNDFRIGREVGKNGSFYVVV